MAYTFFPNSLFEITSLVINLLQIQISCEYEELIALQFGKYSSHYELLGIKVARLKDICNLYIIFSEDVAASKVKIGVSTNATRQKHVISSECL